MLAATLLLTCTSALLVQPHVRPASRAAASARAPRMQEDSGPPAQSGKAAEEAKEIKFAAYEPSKMNFKGNEYKNPSLGGEVGTKLSGPAQFMPYAAAITALALATGGFTESYVEQLVRRPTPALFLYRL